MGGSGGGGATGILGDGAHAYQSWLDDFGRDYLPAQYSLMVKMREALLPDGNPFHGEPPKSPLLQVEYALTALDEMEAQINWMMTEDYISPAVNAFADLVDIDLESSVFPRFETGMRDMNMVNSSAFTVGRAVIENYRQAQVEQFRQNLTIELHKMHQQLYQDSRKVRADFSRIWYLFETQHYEEWMEWKESRMRWPLEVYQYGVNVLGAGGGGTSPVPMKKTSKAAGALGGALSGAATGAMVGGPYGAAIGGVVGGVAGYLSM